MFKRLILLITLVSFVSGCYHRVPNTIEPVISEPPHPKEVQREKRIALYLPQDFSVSPFSPLSAKEYQSDWGKEYAIALTFAQDFDLYRAITGFKRALCLIPLEAKARRQEIEYATALAYYLGKKYGEVVYLVESTDLACADQTFPAFSDLLLILYDSYQQVGKCDHAHQILNLIESDSPDHAKRLTLLSVIKQADFDELCQNYDYENIVCGYRKEAKSIRKAQMLNAVLPGAGYWYVGMKQTAVTALLINALFIGAAAHFISNGNTAAGIITLSLEGGWYFGGISGAGLAAKQYNEQLYCMYADKITQREELFPCLMLKYSF
ncbi:MAG: hypothetical protein S4CHLAM2_04280 [Chlamydiales bacterium]|nr:hypothetical protein [Chlamydiales bacterium]